MNIIRRADRADLHQIHRIQDIPFRDRVFTMPLLRRDEFVQRAERNMIDGLEHYYVHEAEGTVVGFIWLLKRQEWEALTWGKWLNTLLYACGVVAFRKLHLPGLVFSVLDDNKRVRHLYENYRFRNIGQEFYFYRDSQFGRLKTANLTHYKVTPEDLDRLEDQLRKRSLPLSFR